MSKLHVFYQLFLSLILGFSFSYAESSETWEGKFSEEGTSIEIESGTLVRAGEEIEIYDYARDAYIDIEVESVRYIGDGAEIEIFEFKTGRRRMLEME